MHLHISSSPDKPTSPPQPTPPSLHFRSPSAEQPAPSFQVSEMPLEKPKHTKDSSNKRPPDPIDNPSAKRPRETTKPKRRLTWFDAIRNAWPILERDNTGRHQFRIREIIKVVDTHWTSLRGEEKKQKGWRSQLTRAIRKEAMLTRAQLDGQSDLFAMKDPHFQPPPSRPMKKPPVPENETPPEESVYHASIPTEWTAEAFKPVRISTFDKASALQFVNADPNTIKGQKGYRMARATSGVTEGDWYFEAIIVQLHDPADTADGAVRLGWSQRRSDVETPVGFDAYGFGIRDRTGEFVHAARLKSYGERFGVGDVVGCHISLPQLTDEQKLRVDGADRAWLQHRFLSMLQGQAPPDSGIDIIKDGMVQFYKNGTAMGVPSFFEDGRKAALSAEADPTSFEEPNDGRQRKVKGDLKVDSKDKETTSPTLRPANLSKREMKAGVYYPTVAVYGNAIVRANFGPDFQQALPEGCRPMCEAAREAPVVEHEEVIEIADEAPSNPTQSNPATSNSAPHPQPPPRLIQTNPEQGQTANEDSLRSPPTVKETAGTAQRRTEVEEEDGAVEALLDAGRDISRDGTDQPQPEPMAIEA